MNREAWLETCLDSMRVWFDDMLYPLPERIQVSCGWPKARGGKSRAIGQCFDPIWSEDGVCQIFVCPTIGDPIRVADILLHELCHAAVGTTAGHSGPFVKLIRLFGLVGKATATRADPGTDLYARLAGLVEEIGTYPHSVMRAVQQSPKRAPGGGWLRFHSPTLGENYILRISPRSLSEHGKPRDPLGAEMIQDGN